MIQINKILKITQKHSSKYGEWRKGKKQDQKDKLLKRLKLDNDNYFDKVLDAAYKLT